MGCVITAESRPAVAPDTQALPNTMNTAAIGMAASGLVIVTVTIVEYFRSIADAKVTAEVGGLVRKMLIGIGLAAAAVVWAYQTQSLGPAVIGPAALATMLASGILWLLTQRKTPVGELKVAVGDTLLPFEAVNADGTRFHSGTLAGKRTLFKFFRGGW